MATTVFLVRHGQTNSNLTSIYMGWSDEDLNETGYTQVRRLSSRLASLPITAIYTSPLRRAYTTAVLLAEPHQLQPKVVDDLTEIRLGDWQGRHIDDIKLNWPELWQQWRTDPTGITIPHGESLSEVTARAIRALAAIVGASEEQQAVIVTHDVIVKVMVAHILEATNSIYRRFEVSNASLTMIRRVRDRFRLVMLNDTSHLEGLALP